MRSTVTVKVWQRRTHKIVASAIIIIGLTMMISMIPQCIYAGLTFVILALGWLCWMLTRDKKQRPPDPPTHPIASPVLFLVSSHHLSQIPNIVDPTDVPPSYDQILKLDGLPPDYYAALWEKPPRYEDLSSIKSDVSITSESLRSEHPLPLVHMPLNADTLRCHSRASSTHSLPSIGLDISEANQPVVSSPAHSSQPGQNSEAELPSISDVQTVFTVGP